MKKLTFSSVTFVKSALQPKDWPRVASPEVALVGRSNVGKSSLLNLLFGRRLAHVSATPGKTQLLNFFLVDEWYSFVDLPGYGFAKAPQERQKQWVEAIDRYVEQREELKLLLLLLDSRRDLTREDQQFLAWARDRKKGVALVLTKADQLSKTEKMSRSQEILKQCGEELPWVYTSATKKLGRPDLISLLNRVIRDE